MAPMCLPDELQEIITIVLPGIRKMNQRFDVYLEGPGWENFMSDAPASARFFSIFSPMLQNLLPKDGRIILKIEIQETESAKKP